MPIDASGAVHPGPLPPVANGLSTAPAVRGRGRTQGIRGIDADVAARRDGEGMHGVLVPLIAGYQPLDVTVPHEVFATASSLLNRTGGVGGYALRLAAAAPGSVTAASGLALVATEALPEHGPIGTL